MPITAARTTRELATRWPPQHADDLRDVLADDGHDRQQQQQAGKRHPGVHQPLYRQVEFAAHEPSHAADQQRHHHAQGGGGEPHPERHPRPVQQAAEDVATDVVGAQRARGTPVSEYLFGSCDPARESVEEVVTVPGTSLIHAVACDQSGNAGSDCASAASTSAQRSSARSEEPSSWSSVHGVTTPIRLPQQVSMKIRNTQDVNPIPETWLSFDGQIAVCRRRAGATAWRHLR